MVDHLASYQMVITRNQHFLTHILHSLIMAALAGVYPELDFVGGGGRGPSDSFYCPFHARSFLVQSFAIGNTTVWGSHVTRPPTGFAPESWEVNSYLATILIINFEIFSNHAAMDLCCMH